jgi:VanZ family protein
MQTDVRNSGGSPTVAGPPGAGSGEPHEPGAGKRPRTWLLVVFWAAAIFGLSSLPGSTIPSVRVPHLDKVVHVALYATLGALLARALGQRWPATPAAAAGNRKRNHKLVVGKVVLVAWLLAVAYGASDETHQLFVAGRSADPADLAADAVGALVGAFVGTLAMSMISSRRAARCGDPK